MLVRRRTASTFVLALAVSSAMPSPAAARNEVVLDWDAPSGCPDHAQVEAHLDALLGAFQAPPDAPLLRVHARIAPDEAGYRLSLRTGEPDDDGRREIVAPTCEELAESAALIVALLLAPEAMLEPPLASAPEEPVLPPDPDPKPEALPVAPAVPNEAPPANPPRFLFGMGVAVHGDVGTFPSPSLGAAVVGAFAFDRITAEIEAGFLGQGNATFDRDPLLGASFWLLQATARVCHASIHGDRFAVGPCVGIETGALRSEGRGTAVAAAGLTPWLAAKMGAGARWWAHPRWALRVGLDAVLPIVRPIFVIEGIGAVHRVGALSGRASLSIEYRFP